ncbi:MAG TPA: xanthine dehydrogenase family protein molybdopterin-binding subunit [Candidatus Nanopelagicaceae bacterium]|nr:xanthine dehydrogenase family protein molybdopterin-binding subunit [Candidatus Nanopelagicaceae bacterium]
MPEPLAAAPPWVGRGLTRREDRRLVQGQGSYLDDLDFPQAAHVVFVRSLIPHARIRGVDCTLARAMPGVLDIVTAADLPDSVRPLPLRATPLPDGFSVADIPMPILAREEVRFTGEAVAAVLAETAAQAEDAADQVQLDLEPLPAVSGPRSALVGEARVHQELADNVVFRWHGGGGDVGAAFAKAHRVVRGRFSIPRLQASPIETRGCVASFDGQLLSLWCSSQDQHRPRLQLAHVLGLDLDRVRVVVPDVGGAFGSKGGLAAEHAVAAVLAMRQGCPVKWVETRSENFLAAYQGRGMDAEAELAVGDDGRLLGLRVDLVSDAGAYLLGHTAVVAATASGLLTGAYRIPAADVSVLGVATNRVPTGPYRGAGRPEAAFVIERMVDMAAAELGLDPVEMRRRNLVPPEAFPYRTAIGAEYDSGDYPGLLDRALELADYDGERQRQTGARAEGRLRGVGVAVVVESSGNSGWETAAARLLSDGRVLLLPGSSEHGQGHATTFAQIAADQLGIDPAEIDVASGDSAQGLLGMGTFASRSVTVGGSALLLALEELQRRCLVWAAHLLDVPEEQLTWDRGSVRSHDSAASITLPEIAAASARSHSSELPTLQGDGRFTLPGLAYSSCACCVTLEVDPETGALEIERMVAVDDAGTIINPRLAEGQVVGSMVQGLGAAVFEEVLHDLDGQPLTESFLSYAIPSLPDIDMAIAAEFRPTRSPLSPLGTKGVAESGCIAVPAALANAVCDALAPLGVVHADPPYSFERLWTLIGGERS